MFNKLNDWYDGLHDLYRLVITITLILPGLLFLYKSEFPIIGIIWFIILSIFAYFRLKR